MQSKESKAVCERLCLLLQVIPAQGAGLIATPGHFKLAGLKGRRCEVVGGFFEQWTLFLPVPAAPVGVSPSAALQFSQDQARDIKLSTGKPGQER